MTAERADMPHCLLIRRRALGARIQQGTRTSGNRKRGDDMRLVDADALKAKSFGKRGGLIHTSDIDAMPTVDAVPVVHSEWIPKEKSDTPYGLEMECAKCGFSVIVNDALYFKFCPVCGAKMDGKDGDGNG